MNYPSPKSTERLNIRPLTLKDVPAWERFLANKEATKLFPASMISRPNYAHFWIEKQIERYDEGRYGLMALELKSSGEFVGQCGLLLQTVDDEEVLEIGYHLLPEHWGNGYATEAAKFFKTYAGEHQLAKSVTSIIHVDNIASQKVAERNGMRKTKQTDWRGMKAWIYSGKL